MEKSALLQEAYNGSYYTILGCGGDLNEWKEGYQGLLDEKNIGTITKWVQFTGRDLNEEFGLTDPFNDDLIILAFSLDGLQIGKLATFKLQMGDRWFDDVIDNARQDEVSDSRRIKDSAVDIEDAVYEKFINASAETRDELVELIDKNYDMEEFESTDDLANSLYNYLDFLLPQLTDEAVLDLEESGYL